MIKEIREKTGMTQKEFADFLELPSPLVKEWEWGTKKCPEYVIRLIKRILEQEGKI